MRCPCAFVYRWRRTLAGAGGSEQRQRQSRRTLMLKFIGGTAGVIFIIGLIVVIALFKLLF